MKNLKDHIASSRDMQERLVQGEVIVEAAEIHPAVYWKAVAVFVLSVLVALMIAKELGLVLALAGLGMAVHAVLLQKILMMVVTNKRVLVRYGILQVDVVDIHFDKIESIELERMLPGYLFGYANVVIMGTGNRYIVVPFVANALAIRRAYNEQTLGAKS